MTDGVRQLFRHRRARSARAGFTLLEMLIAVTLLALITALLTGTLRFGLRVWETGERMDGEARVAAVQRLLFQWLHESEQVPMPGEDGDALRGVFEGNTRAVRFLGVQHGIGLPGGYYLNDLYLGETEEGRPALMLRRRLVQPNEKGLTDAAPPESTRGRVLLEGVASVDIAYFGRETAAADPAWLESWRGRLDLPGLVRVRVRFEEGSRRQWPDLVVPLGMARGWRAA